MSAVRAPLRRRLDDRGGFQPRAIVVIALVWCLLWDRLSWGNLLNGVLVGVFVTVIFPLPSIPYVGRLRPLGLAVLLGRFFLDLIKASFQVTAFTLRPSPPPRGSIIEVPLRAHSDLYLTLTSVLIALVPGSIVIDARRAAGVLFVHDLLASTEEEIEECRERVLAVERRLVHAIGSREEIDALDAGREFHR